MSNAIILTGYQRPELFRIQCEQLLKNKEEFDKYTLHLFLDYNYDPDYHKVLSWLKPLHKNIKLTLRSQEDKNKSPLPGFYNILDSYKKGIENCDKFLIVLEEDIIGTQDYLRFNRICYEKFLSKHDKIFCVGHKRRCETEQTGKINQLIGDSQLCSPSCISVNMIKKYILPHLTDELYNNPINYYKKYFNNIRIPYNEHIHADGFIEKIMLLNNLYSIKPDQSRSMHLGVGGLHSSKLNLPVGLDNKIKWYCDMISKGSAELRKYTETAKEDIVVCSLDNPPWTDLEIDFDRNKCIASSVCYDRENNFKKEIINEN